MSHWVDRWQRQRRGRRDIWWRHEEGQGVGFPCDVWRRGTSVVCSFCFKKQFLLNLIIVSIADPSAQSAGWGRLGGVAAAAIDRGQYAAL